MTDVSPAAVTALEHQVVAARARATVLRLGRHAKAAAAELDAAQQLQEQLDQLRTAASEKDSQRCQCEHADHVDVPAVGHPYLGVPAGDHRAMFVGPVCDGCATGHLAEYLVDHTHRAAPEPSGAPGLVAAYGGAP